MAAADDTFEVDGPNNRGLSPDGPMVDVDVAPGVVEEVVAGGGGLKLTSSSLSSFMFSEVDPDVDPVSMLSSMAMVLLAHLRSNYF